MLSARLEQLELCSGLAKPTKRMQARARGVGLVDGVGLRGRGALAHETCHVHPPANPEEGSPHPPARQPQPLPPSHPTLAPPQQGPAPRVAVDGVFARRLAKILRLCIPSLWSVEAGLVAGQGALLVARSLLTDYMSRIEGAAGRYIIAQDFARLRRVMAAFCLTALPASVVNSGLK